MIDLSKLSPAPWTVQTWKYDDWGMVRDSSPTEFGIGLPVASTCFELQGNFDEFRAKEKFGTPVYIRGPERIAANAEFIALARNAFEVMMRRGWMPRSVLTVSGTFLWEIVQIADKLELALSCPERHDDPFTALVEADRWYAENVERKERK